ncbi:non-specific lipid transfer protein GPI-anchored 14-like isoform X1 [Salvia miltiorrhiza]|uniref:non-specific lipid transfer protein GPI-anchored 14-like isoform X1 n=1 Tax=Salvia miltiorrhiza TaxID=226208 RepID=UPI0025ABB074|nr:non-specific lipid transfer protein GPI-anchored 14-like isoform X1 [Salvia miltiorrhiza]
MNTLKSSFLLASMVMLFRLSGCDNSKDKEACAESLVGLATCLPYVGGTAKSPTPDCCNGLKQLLKTNKKCLCVVIKDRNDPDLGLNINVTLALSLPHVCNAPANISQCPALLNLPPNSPDAQVFYQLEKNSSSVAGAVPPNPSSAPAGAPTSQPKNGGCDKGLLLAGLLLLPALLLSSLLL